MVELFTLAFLICLYGLLSSLPRREYVYTRAEKRELRAIERDLKELEEL